jgi:hypothetical protein
VIIRYGLLVPWGLSMFVEIFREERSMNGTRPLTLAMIWRLHEGPGILVKCLIKQAAAVAV